MNELALFAGAYANAMTVKQVAEALGVELAMFSALIGRCF